MEGHVIEGGNGENDSRISWGKTVLERKQTPVFAAEARNLKPTDKVGSEEEDVLSWLLVQLRLALLLRWRLLRRCGYIAIAICRLFALISASREGRLLSSCSGAHCDVGVGWVILGR